MYRVKAIFSNVSTTYDDPVEAFVSWWMINEMGGYFTIDRLGRKKNWLGRWRDEWVDLSWNELTDQQRGQVLQTIKSIKANR